MRSRLVEEQKLWRWRLIWHLALSGDAAAALKIVLELLEEAAAVGLAPERHICCWSYYHGVRAERSSVCSQV